MWLESQPLRSRAWETLTLTAEAQLGRGMPNTPMAGWRSNRLNAPVSLTRCRSKAALRLKFEVCKELRGHMELLPETGYIQALSSYSVQLKFLPRWAQGRAGGARASHGEGRVQAERAGRWCREYFAAFV